MALTLAPHDASDSVSFDEFGLSAFTYRTSALPHEVTPGGVTIMPTHNHLEVELTFVESGAIVLEFSGVAEQVRPFEPALYWGGVPHRVLRVAPGSVFHVVQVPLVDMLSWTNSGRMLGFLLDGQFLREPPDPREAAAEPVMFARWRRHLRAHDQELRRSAELEIEARFRRFVARVIEPTGRSARGPESATAARLVAVTRFVMSHFTESITVDDVATAVGWHHDYLMASFRRFCGITLWGYVTRVRLAEAQRLLTTTDLPITQVCYGAGFGSTSQLYEVFKRHRHTTPARYRRSAAATTSNWQRPADYSPPSAARTDEAAEHQVGVVSSPRPWVMATSVE